MSDPIRDVVQKILDAAPQKKVEVEPLPETKDTWIEDARTWATLVAGFVLGCAVTILIEATYDNTRTFPFDILLGLLGIFAVCVAAIVFLTPKD